MTETEVAAVVRGLAPVVREMVTKATESHATALHDRLITLERKAVDDTIATRLAALEARAPIPGPPGAAGANGKDGSDGLGFDELQVVQTDERTFEVIARRGDITKGIGVVHVPVDLYCGVYVDGKQYARGDNVTYQGSVWHCNEETRERPNGGKAWTLKVKRGRDGKQ